MTVKREGRSIHDCTDNIPPPIHHNVGTIAECDECGRRWKLAGIGWTFKEWHRTRRTRLGDFVRGERAICRHAAVGRWLVRA